MNKEISVAPMMDWTDRHCRYFLRLIAPHVRLYTEMVTTGAILHGDADRHLRFDAAEHPVALQLGGSEPAALAECTRIGADYGYDEINLNCGCPSDRVQNGAFGACLMATPDHVAKCIEAMIAASPVPVTVKCRIGIDDCDEFSFLNRFINSVSKAGCQKFIIHARKAWLKGLSPKENREIPPLRHDIAQNMKNKYQGIEFVLNGGIRTVEEVKHHLSFRRKPESDQEQAEPDPGLRRDDSFNGFDGVMIGREAYQNPWILADIEREIFGNASILTREAVARAMIPYIGQQMRDHGTPVKTVTRHMLGLYNNLPGARAFRRVLSENREDDPRVIEKALQHLSQRPEKRIA